MNSEKSSKLNLPISAQNENACDFASESCKDTTDNYLKQSKVKSKGSNHQVKAQKRSYRRLKYQISEKEQKEMRA